jgi:ABC-type transporter Mla MlaB component
MDMEKTDLATRSAMTKAENQYRQMTRLFEPDLPLSNIEKVDTPTLQRLLEFHQTLAKDNHNLAWPNPSEQVMMTVKLLGIDKHIT